MILCFCVFVVRLLQLLIILTSCSNVPAATRARERCRPLPYSRRCSAPARFRDSSTVPVLAAATRCVGLPVTFAASPAPLRFALASRIPAPGCVLAASWLPLLDRTAGSVCLICETR